MNADPCLSIGLLHGLGIKINRPSKSSQHGAKFQDPMDLTALESSKDENINSM